MKLIYFALLLAVGFRASFGQVGSISSGCNYLANNTFTCNWVAGNSLWTATTFGTNHWYNQIPQSLTIYDVNGAFPTGIFTQFSTWTGSPLMINTVPTQIKIQCSTALTSLGSTSFTGLSSHPTLIIEYCDIGSLQTGAFTGTNLTSLTMRYGTIGSLAVDALSGLSFQSGDFVGTLNIEKMRVTPKEFPAGFFSQASNLQFLNLRYVGITSFTQSVISGATSVKTLDLTGNDIHRLLEGTFDGLNSLWHINLAYFIWHCHCESVWLFYWADTYRIQLDGEFLCTTPSEYQNQRLYSYNQTVCAETPTIDPLEALIGVALFFALILAVAAFVMALTLKAHLNHRRQMVDAKAKNIIIWREQEEHTIEFDKDGNVKAVDGETRGEDEKKPEEKGADSKTPNGDTTPESKEPKAEPAKGKEEPSEGPEKTGNPPAENLGSKDDSPRPATGTGRTENHPHMPKDPDADNDSGKVTAVES